MKLSKKQITVAVNRFARKRNYSVDTVRTTTLLFYAALIEYRGSYAKK